MKFHAAQNTFPKIITCLIAVSVLATTLATSSTTGAAPLPVPERGFISSQPATTWEEGLITGNGTIGANVLSRPLDETVVFTHERLFLPDGKPIMPPNIAPRLFELRRLIERGLYKQATQFAFDQSTQEDFMYPDPFVPAFDLRVKMDGDQTVRDYMRSTDFQTGVTTVQWTNNIGTFERKLFVSRKDGLAVMQITGPGKGKVNCRMTLTPRMLSDKVDSKKIEKSATLFKSHVSDIKVNAQPSAVTYRNSYTKAYPGSIHALEGVAQVVTDGGTITPKGPTLSITGANSVLIFIDIELIHNPKKSKMNDMQQAIAALPKDFDTLLKGHVAIHGDLFNRVKLNIGGGADHKLTTEQLMLKSTNENLNKALIEKQFDAGRYNIICCTGELPPNLQGVWGGTYCPDWASDYTHNGNVPSAIAATMSGNTPELMLAYTNYIESIEPWLELNAKRIFNSRGVVLPSRSTTHGMNNAFGPTFAGAFWVGGAPWAAHFFYDYYLYTGDKKFLAEKALPFMEKCCLFFEDYCTEGPDGKYVFSPTQSPENTPSNSDSQGSLNSTMSIAAAKEVLTNTIAASKELGVNKDKIPTWEKMLAKMPDYQIDPKEGTVKEWTTPRLEENLAHRHSSQLYALYDGLPPEIENNPKLREAFKKIIDIKLNRYWTGNARGFMSFGLVQLGQAATSLEDKELAYQCLIHLVNRYWLSNLASMHNHKHLFNMDISGGMPHVILKMLAASDPGRIKLLPACPSQWPTGTVEGILCRGQVEIKRMTWTPNSIQVTLLSGKNQQVHLVAPATIASVAVTKGNATVAKTNQPTCCTATLPAGKEVTLQINLK